MWIKRKTYEDLMETLEAQSLQITNLKNDYMNQVSEHVKDGEELQKQIDHLSAELDKNIDMFTKSDSNEVTLRIADDMTTITPIVRWKDNTPEKLIEIGALNDSQNSKTSTQVALMAIAHEALTDIMDSFLEPVGDE